MLNGHKEKVTCLSQNQISRMLTTNSSIPLIVQILSIIIYMKSMIMLTKLIPYNLNTRLKKKTIKPVFCSGVGDLTKFIFGKIRYQSGPSGGIELPPRDPQSPILP